MGPDPFHEFQSWFDEAGRAGEKEPEAMTLATATPDGVPSARIVLLKGFDGEGFRFFTNYESRKGRELEANSAASLLFYWPLCCRQVRIEGRAEKLPAAASDEYFASRPRLSQIGAWASPQSRPIPDREHLELAALKLEKKFAGKEIPRPPHWGGYLLVPGRFEFWTRGESRLHDRFLYSLGSGGAWTISRLGPSVGGVTSKAPPRGV